MKPMVRRSLVSVGLMIAGAVTGGVPSMATAEPSPDPSPPVATVQPPAPGDGKRVLQHDYQAQPNSYYCAPAATRIALSTQGQEPSQKDVAKKLGTTKDGTQSADDTTRVLNEVTGGGYETTKIGESTASPEQTDKLRTDVVQAVDAKRGVVANTMGTAVDTTGRKHQFPGGHYVSIIGYRDGGEAMKIADPYGQDGHYWMDDENVADWIAQRGYSS